MGLRVLICPVMMYAMAASDLGMRIRRAREAKRLRGKEMRQEDLAALLGVSARTVGRWERGEVEAPRSSIGALEQVLGVSLAEDSDPAEEELRATLERLRESSLISVTDMEHLLAMYKERKRRSRGNGVADRAG